MKNRPPLWADRILEWFCNPVLLEDLQGDLYEIYEYHRAEGNTRKGQLAFIWLVLRSFRPSVIARKKYKTNTNQWK